MIREAFSAGNPVIATRLGDTSSFSQGLLYEPDAQGELDYALERLTTEPGLGQSLVEEQPRVATMAEHATEIAEIFRSIANETEYG